MKKNEIYVLYGTEILNMTEEILRLSDLKRMILDKCGSYDARIALKPNLLGPVPAGEGATTHPEITEGVIRYLKSCGFTNICVMEGSWVGDRTEDSLLVCGYARMLKRMGVPFFDLQKDSSRNVDCAGMRLRVCEKPLDVDFLINLPVMKGHCQTRMTCALKNMKGCIPNSEKRRFHRLGLHDPIGHLSAGIHQDFILTDDICPDLTFEDGGNPVEQNRIFTSADPVLNDAYALYLMHLYPEDVPYVPIAEACGIGSSDLSQAQIHVLKEAGDRSDKTWHYETVTGETAGKGIGEKTTSSGRKKEGSATGANGESCPPGGGKSCPDYQKILHVKELVEEVDSCSACYGILIPVLQKLEEEGYPVAGLSGICIGQGFRGKTGKVGIGNCTSGFEKTLPGCPPSREEAERFLKGLM